MTTSSSTLTFVINLVLVAVIVGLVAIDLVAAEAFATQGKMSISSTID